MVSWKESSSEKVKSCKRTLENTGSTLHLAGAHNNGRREAEKKWKGNGIVSCSMFRILCAPLACNFSQYFPHVPLNVSIIRNIMYLYKWRYEKQRHKFELYKIIWELLCVQGHSMPCKVHFLCGNNNCWWQSQKINACRYLHYSYLFAYIHICN